MDREGTEIEPYGSEEAREIVRLIKRLEKITNTIREEHPEWFQQSLVHKEIERGIRDTIDIIKIPVPDCDIGQKIRGLAREHFIKPEHIDNIEAILEIKEETLASMDSRATSGDVTILITPYGDLYAEFIKEGDMKIKPMEAMDG